MFKKKNDNEILQSNASSIEPPYQEDDLNEEGDKKKLGLTARILIALALGIIVGVVFHYLVPAGPIRDDVFVKGIFYVIDQGFIRLFQMLVVPLVFCSIVCGTASIGDTKTLSSVGVKTLAFYICTTALAVCVALGVANIINPGLGVDMSIFNDPDAGKEVGIEVGK